MSLNVLNYPCLLPTMVSGYMVNNDNIQKKKECWVLDIRPGKIQGINMNKKYYYLPIVHIIVVRVVKISTALARVRIL